MYLYGASGHAKVIRDILSANGIIVEKFIDDNPNICELSGIPVIHEHGSLEPIIISIGNCKVRKAIAESLNCKFGMAIHPSAIIGSSVNIGEGSVVMQGSIIQVDTIIGKHCIINTKASIDHECSIDDYVHIAPGCTISGNVHIGECSWIGVGTVIKQDIQIGKNCIIGAGSVVVRDIPDNAEAYGVPCKVIKMNI